MNSRRRIWVTPRGSCPCNAGIYHASSALSAAASHLEGGLAILRTSTNADIPPNQISPSNLACLNRILAYARYLAGEMGYVQRVHLMQLTIFAFAVLVATIQALAHSWYPLACCG